MEVIQTGLLDVGLDKRTTCQLGNDLELRSRCGQILVTGNFFKVHSCSHIILLGHLSVVSDRVCFCCCCCCFVLCVCLLLLCLLGGGGGGVTCLDTKSRCGLSTGWNSPGQKGNPSALGLSKVYSYIVSINLLNKSIGNTKAYKNVTRK